MIVPNLGSHFLNWAQLKQKSELGMTNANQKVMDKKSADEALALKEAGNTCYKDNDTTGM